jgi:DNA-binding transcriptional ArsR family regulator
MPKDPDAPASSEDAAPVRFDSPRSIRALAHPARLAIINALATGEELTATQCAELTGLSPSATAYHLKLLERYGFAEPAPQRTDRRERPWRTTGRRVQVDPDSSTPAGASAASAVVAAYFDTTRALGLAFAAGEHAEPEEWRNAVLSNADLWLTVEEVERISHQLEAVLEPLRRRALRGERPEGSRRVRVMNVVVPHPRTHPQPVPPRP